MWPPGPPECHFGAGGNGAGAGDARVGERGGADVAGYVARRNVQHGAVAADFAHNAGWGAGEVGGFHGQEGGVGFGVHY